MRRYGVTVVSYTWTMLRDLVEAPPNPAERHHPVRLFVGLGHAAPGSGGGSLDRFAPARRPRVLRLDRGRRDPREPRQRGSPARWAGRCRAAPSAARRRTTWTPAACEESPDGSYGRAERDEVGLLLARGDADDRGRERRAARRLRAGDAWLATGDLFRRDDDGDYWLLGTEDSVVDTADGPVLPRPVTDALERLPVVDLALLYPVGPLAVAAVVLHPGARLDPAELTGALAAVPGPSWPAAVRVVPGVATTAWHRPLVGPLVEEGLPASTAAAPAWARNAAGTGYVRLDRAALRRLAARAARASAAS